jgi:hypothetical protein
MLITANKILIIRSLGRIHEKLFIIGWKHSDSNKANNFILIKFMCINIFLTYIK